MKRAATLALALVAGLLTAAGPAQAGGPVDVTPDVANLQTGALPSLPYVDWPNREIVDGSKHVSIAGIKARVTALHKVDGGYLLGRRINQVNSDLVFVSTKGARKVLVPEWERPGFTFPSLSPGLAVSHNGDKVLVNANFDVGGEAVYQDTRVLSLPGGKLLRTRNFGDGEGDGAGILAFGVDRAAISVGNLVSWWNPAKNTLSKIANFAFSGSMDLTAWQWAFTDDMVGQDQSVRSIPPRTSTHWGVDPDERFGPWSPNDSKVVGLDKLTQERGESSRYTVFNSANGTALLTINGNLPAQISWETDSTLLLRTRIEGTETYQLIRCTLAGVCQKVGPSTTDLYGSIIPATRRNS